MIRIQCQMIKPVTVTWYDKYNVYIITDCFEEQ